MRIQLEMQRGAVRLHASLLALPLFVWAAGCSSIRVQVERAEELENKSYATYAYTWEDAFDESSPEEEEGFETDEWSDEEEVFPHFLLARLEESIDEEMTRRGLRRVGVDEAGLLVSYEVEVEQKTRFNDPFYAFWTTEEFEQGTLALVFFDPKTRREVWKGTSRAPLRDLARGTGLLLVRYRDVEEDREWDVSPRVEALLSRFP